MQQYIELLILLQTSVTNLGSTGTVILGTVLAVKVILVLEEMPEMKTMNDSENPPTASDIQLDSPSMFFCLSLGNKRRT